MFRDFKMSVSRTPFLSFVLFCLFGAGSDRAAQAGLELPAVPLAPPKCWNYRHEPIPSCSNKTTLVLFEMDLT